MVQRVNAGNQAIEKIFEPYIPGLISLLISIFLL